MLVGTGDLFDKSELNEFIIQRTKNYNKDLLDVYVSERTLEISTIKDVFGNDIFEGIEGEVGWMVFVDPCKIANWSHPCEYWFIKNEQVSFFNHEGKWPPISEINRIKLNLF
jgi:hypothetical protein